MPKFDYVSVGEIVQSASKLGTAVKKLTQVADQMKIEKVDQYPSEWTDSIRSYVDKILSASLKLEMRLALHLVAQKAGVKSEMELAMEKSRKNKEYAQKRIGDHKPPKKGVKK